MDNQMNQWAESGSYIWLRYSTQYIKDGQTHTIEMSVPVPIGASAETRERLIREAESGMSQLTSHVERSGAQRVQSAPATQSSQVQAQNAPGTQRLAPQPATNTRPTPVPRQIVRPAAVSAPPTSSQPSMTRETDAEQDTGGRNFEQTRQNAASPVSRAPGRLNEGGNNMLLPQFIQYIKENLDLTPKQAMELLNVRSLSTGINLRDAVEQLKQLTGREPVNGVRRQDNSDGSFIRESAFSDEEPERAGNTGPLARSNRNSPPIVEMRIGRPAPTFDEQVGPDELEEADETFDDEDLEDLEPSRELSPQMLEIAQDKLGELRETQGAATASAGRLQALNNVAVSQVTEEQLQELADGVWGISSLKKLKVDQVEALISWAKLEDDFADQVEAVLILLEEEHYARGNR